jgi:hypothetical protein
VGKTERGNGTKIMAVARRHGLPAAISTASATPHQVALVGSTLAEFLIEDVPQRLIGDSAYGLRANLRFRKPELVRQCSDFEILSRAALALAA